MAHFWTGDDPDLTFVSYTQQSDKDCYIVFKAWSSASKTTKLTATEYSINGIDWFPMTDLWPGEGEDITSLSASPTGTNHTFAWNSNLDLGASFDGAVRARFTIKNWDDTGNVVTVTSDWFTLDFAAPTCSVGWPDGETISDSTPLLQRNASDNSPPIETDWVIDDDPAFLNGNGRQQTKAWSADTNFQVATLAVMGTWYFKIRCRDSSPSVNTSGWDLTGEFELMTAIKPAFLTDGVDTVRFIVDEVIVGIKNRLKEYDADGNMNAGGANIVEWVHRKPLTITLRMIDGPANMLPSGTFENYEQCMTWYRANTLLDVEDIGGNPIGVGGVNINYTPSDWVIVNIRIINRPKTTKLLYYEVVLEEV